MITNKHNLPLPIVKAIEAMEYDPGVGDFSITELISPPKIATLRKRHKDKIEEDASDMLYSFMGTAIHNMMEQHGKNAQGYKVEERHYAQYGKWKVSAKYDAFFVDGCRLSDYKVTTTYSFMKNKDGSQDIKKEWAAQLNVQADILRRDIGADIKELEIVGILRDWQPTKAATDPCYPQNQIVILKIPIVSPEYVEKWVLERCALHEAARQCEVDDLIPPCTKEERWEEDSAYAVMKKGGKRAIKRFPTIDDAVKFIEDSNDSNLLSIEPREGFPRRCQGIGAKVYCSCRNFCNHYKSLQKENK